MWPIRVCAVDKSDLSRLPRDFDLDLTPDSIFNTLVLRFLFCGCIHNILRIIINCIIVNLFFNSHRTLYSVGISWFTTDVSIVNEWNVMLMVLN